MSKLSREDILKLARLARLRLSDDEVDQFTQEITSILQYVEQLSELDLNDVQPTLQVTGLSNVMRADEEINYGASPADLLQNAPEIEGDLIKVKRMIA